MTEAFKIAAVGIIAALCALVVKQQSREIGLVLTLGAGAIILLFCAPGLSGVLDMVSTLGEAAGLSASLIAPVMKTVGIGLVTKISAEACLDAGERGLASFVELGGSVAALLVALPLLQTVLTVINGLI